MAKITIRVDARTGVTYLPKEVRREGFVGEIEGLANALTLTLIKPDSKLADVERSLEIILQDIRLRKKQEVNMDQNIGENKPVKLPTMRENIAPPRRHPLFDIFTRSWITSATGYTLSYLSRVATGKAPITRSFIDRCCFSLNRTEKELFFTDEKLD